MAAFTQLAVVWISSVVTGSTGIDAVAEFSAADDTAVGVTSAMASQAAEISAAEPANRFMVLPCLLIRRLDIAQKNAPVLYERDGPAAGLFGWHPDTRGPQIYALFASDGTTAKFNLEPDAKTDPTSCGWKLIASVDTRPKQGDSGGQYGVSITDASGSLGKFRYLLFDAVPTESDDAWGNTFFSEIDVVAKK